MLKPQLTEFLSQFNEYYPSNAIFLALGYIQFQSEEVILDFFFKHVLPRQSDIAQHDIQVVKYIINERKLSIQSEIDSVWKLIDEMDEEDRETLWEWVDTLISLAAKYKK